MKRFGLLAMLASTVWGQTEATPRIAIKKEILALAQSYAGQGDPDRSKQRSLDTLIEKLLQASPQPAVKSRLNLIQGAWKQVWGAYDYRGNKRGVDPTLGTGEIYQVVFEQGYYYNISPSYKNGNRATERIGLLRGHFELDPKNENLLRVRFTNLFGLQSRPAGKLLPELAASAESNALPGRKTVIPSFVVKLLSGGGALREVYTDEDMRITYGSDGKNLANDYLYVMTRVQKN